MGWGWRGAGGTVRETMGALVKKGGFGLNLYIPSSIYNTIKISLEVGGANCRLGATKGVISSMIFDSIVQKSLPLLFRWYTCLNSFCYLAYICAKSK